MSKISELSDGGVIQGGDTLIAVRSGGNVKVTYGGSTTANIDGGTIDGTVIGGTTPAAGSFTTLTASGDVNFDSNTLFVDSSANAVGVNTSSPYTALDVSGGTTNQVGIFRSTDATATVGFADNTTPLTGSLSYVTLGAVGNNMVFNTNLVEAMRIDSSGNLGLNVVPSAWSGSWKAFQNGFRSLAQTAAGAGDWTMAFNAFFDSTDSRWEYQYTGDSAVRYSQTGAGVHAWFTSPVGTAGNAITFTQAMTLDASGNLLVGTTSAYAANAVTIASGGIFYASRNGGSPATFRRNSDDGAIVTLEKDGTIVGSIGTQSSVAYMMFYPSTGLRGGSASIVPATTDGAVSDNAKDWGSATVRWDDIYATNGTIQTSDRNEKQDIEELSEAEQRVAVAAKGLLRKFRWKDSVAEKGDEARTHFGIIAQDLQAAFEAEGLDAGDYAMFIHSTWTDEETGEERSRMGVRYSELLAFIIAAI